MGSSRLLIGLFSPYFGATLGGGEKYLGVAAEALRDGFPDAAVEIASTVPVDRPRYERELGLDLGRIELHPSNRRLTPLHRLGNRLTPLRPLRNRVIAVQAARATRRYDVYLAMAYRIPVRSRAGRSVMLCQFPYRSREGVDDFELIVCQSQYVREWVRRYWARDALVINPPIDVPNREPEWGHKQPLILSVGRFFAGGHDKRHDVLIDAFKRLYDLGTRGWRLNIAGSVHRVGPHAGHLERLRRSAAGYPIEFHPDVPRDQLLRLYDQASLYWHAAGYGLDDNGDPEAREHFGMTVAEAMGHGAVPLVFAAGGVGEVVVDGRDGMHWASVDQLANLSLRLIRDQGERGRLARAAREAAGRFARPVFKRRVIDTLEPLVAGATR
jgi:glycosyltransferase involved in cell wall biosynthesis